MVPATLMKKLGAVTLGGFLLWPLIAAASTINIDAGYLRGTDLVAGDTTGANASLLSTATTASPNGGALLLLIASGSASGTTFTTPSAGQYVAGGDVILSYSTTSNGVTTTNTGFQFNNNGGTQTTAPMTGQETLNLLTAVPNPTGISASAYIELRWYPSITLAQYLAGATPAANSYYGAYNPLVTNLSGNTTLNPDGGLPWQLPAASANGALNLFTTDDQSGSQAVAEGYANMMVPVPEPSTGLLSGLALVITVGATGVWQRSKKVKVG